MIVGKHIKNIIFDLGGVIINLDYDAPIRAFAELGRPDFKTFYTQANQAVFFDAYDRGQISSEQFLDELRKLFPGSPDNAALINAWNTILLDIPRERLELLEKLKSKYRLFLLSNTNDIHIQELEKYYLATFGFSNLSHFFEKEYLSYQIGMRKPDAEIFEHVLTEQGLKAAETLFIEDSIQHIVGARACGIEAYHLQSPETILDIDFWP